MEMIYFTLVAIVLYLAADRLLNWIELRRGERFEHRSLIFFVIILVLAITVFNLIQYFVAGQGQPLEPGPGGSSAGQEVPVTR